MMFRDCYYSAERPAYPRLIIEVELACAPLEQKNCSKKQDMS
jgi:hypothetical protein